MRLDNVNPLSSDIAPYLQHKHDGMEASATFVNEAFLYGFHALLATSRALYLLLAPQTNLVHVVAEYHRVLS